MLYLLQYKLEVNLLLQINHTDVTFCSLEKELDNVSNKGAVLSGGLTRAYSLMLELEIALSRTRLREEWEGGSGFCGRKHLS